MQETAHSPVAAVEEAHNPALDGLRFFAFFGVFLFHAIGGVRVLLLGAFGVRVFFVLSGFLIGGILLRQREDAARLGHKLRVFYIRRVLRIFPLYYGVLLIVWLLPKIHCDILGVSDGMRWQAAYLTNIYRYLGGTPRCTSHFWSLAIEEQFYLIVPLLLLMARLRAIELGLVCLWAVNGSLHVLNWMTFQNPDIYLLSNIQFGYLGFGIAAAMIQRNGSFLGITPRRVYWGGVACAPLAILIVGLWGMGWMSEGVFLDLFEWPVTFLSAVLILAIWRRESGMIGKALSASPFVYLGRISYGLYVFHYLVVVFLNRADVFPLRPFAFAGTAFAITTSLAVMSWHLFERPFNRLKRFFPYEARSLEAV